MRNQVGVKKEAKGIGLLHVNGSSNYIIYCVKAVLNPNQFFLHEEINVPPFGVHNKNHEN
jgi:hypothetical protein